MTIALMASDFVILGMYLYFRLYETFIKVSGGDWQCLCGQLSAALWTTVHCHVSLPQCSSD